MPRSHNYRITSLSSFEEATSEPRQIAGLYFYQILDCLVDLAHVVSADFRKRPQLYRDLGEPSIAKHLAKLYAQYGTEITVPARHQRIEVYFPIFGANETDSFPCLRDDLIRAARAFAERSANDGIEMLKDGVRTSHRPFKDYLLGLQGDSVRFSEDALSELTENTCYPILRSQAVAAVFGIAKKAAADYPYASDPAEDLLVEQISTQLTSANNTQTVISRERISNLQRVALRGTEAIATAIDFEEADPGPNDAELELLISKCYTWGTALASLKTRTNISSNQSAQPTASVSSTPSTAPKPGCPPSSATKPATSQRSPYGR